MPEVIIGSSSGDHESNPRNDPHLAKETSRTLWIGLGFEIVLVVVTAFVRGTFLLLTCACFGLILIIRGWKPGLFAHHFEAKIIEQRPYQRKESLARWTAGIFLCLLFSGTSTFLYKEYVPARRDLTATILDGVQRIVHQESSTHNSDGKSAPSAKPTNPSGPSVKLYEPPVERTAKFTVMIPFDTAPNAFPIPRDENPDDPLFRTYSDFHYLATNGTMPQAARKERSGQVSWKITPVSMKDAPAFFGRLLQYDIFHNIDSLQRDSMTVTLGAPTEASAGIEPPNAVRYPYEKLSKRSVLSNCA